MPTAIRIDSQISESRATTVAVLSEEASVPRKITKIVGLNGGGFSVLAPYHEARSGFLCKMPVDPAVVDPGTRQVLLSEVVGFTAESRAKLSYHVDGFAQFSSEKQGEIISGRDPDTGEPKGLGLMTHPLTAPIWSGPSAALTVWGLNDFEPMEDLDDGLVFRPKDFYYRECEPATANGWVLQIFAFPIGSVPPCRYENGDLVCDVAIERLSGLLISVMRMKIVRLPKEKVFLGLAMNRAVVSFPSASGWVLSGPGDHSAKKKGHVLMAYYPRGAIPVDGRASLNREKQDRNAKAVQQSAAGDGASPRR
jgi:hypothetical protein